MSRLFVEKQVTKLVLWFALLGFLCKPACAADESMSALIQAQASGGLIIQVGCSDHQQALRLAQTGRYLVQVLDSKPQRVQAAREAIQQQHLYGLITIDQFETAGRLPHAENLANVVFVADAKESLPLGEVVRVLCPGGLAIVPQSASAAEGLRRAGLEKVATLGPASPWLAGRKPWPAKMDQWPQPRHAADGNAVSQDSLVGPPRRVRWVAGPPQEISNMVSADGRNYYGGVIARDAFNGLLLWQRKLDPSPARGGFGYRPASDAPRPIAVGRELLILGGTKLTALDGATGAIVREYPAAGTPRETLVDAGLILTVEKESIRAIEYQRGSLRWKYEAAEPRCVVAGDGGVYFIHGDPRRGQTVRLARLDEKTGRDSWEQKDLDWLPKVRQCVYHRARLVCEVSTVADEKQGNMIHVLSAADGKPLWSRTFVPGSAHMKQARAMFVGDLVWLLTENGCVALDPASGEQKKAFPGGWGHCFPPVATSRFILHGEMHLTDLETGRLDANPITKGNCSRDVGFLAANGLIYTTPKHCICWPMLRDYTALAPARGPDTARPRTGCEKGPAVAPSNAVVSGPEEWPCYRHDAWRSASTPATIPTAPKLRWTTKLGAWPEAKIADDWRANSYVRGPVTPPVIAGGLVFVARVDAHQVVALDVATGEVRWRYTANGRIDTPATIHRGLCLFGAKSGWVYALRADDGRLVWRLRAAPGEERIVAYGQVESPWPVPGSVLVVDDLLYFAAGRQPLADGGVRVFAVEPATGKLRWDRLIREVPQQFDKVKHPFYNSSGLEFDNFDLLNREGDRVAMSRWLLDCRTGNVTCDRSNGFARVDMEDAGGGVWAPRGCWSYAPRNESEHRKERPFLRPLAAFRGDRLFSFAEDRKTVFRRDFDLAHGEKFDPEWFAGWKTYEQARKGGDLWRSQRLARNAKWSVTPFPQAKEAAPGNAMLLAANALVIAGAAGDLAILSPQDGQVMCRVQSPTVLWDGLAAAKGQLFATTQEGDVLCLAEK